MSGKIKVKEYKRKTVVKAHTRNQPTTKQKEQKPKRKMPKLNIDSDNESKNKIKAIKYEPKKEKKWVKITEATGGNMNKKRDVYELQD